IIIHRFFNPDEGNYWCILVAKFGALLFSDFGAVVVTDYTYLLLSKSKAISIKLWGENNDGNISLKISKSELMHIGIIFLGLITLTLSIPYLVYDIFNFYIHKRDDLLFNLNEKYNLIYSCTEVLLGILIIIYAKGLKSVLEKNTSHN
ncbi:MAG: hypothetical protein ACK40G_12200, partial [Cytophagaceae bacterium]